MASINFACRYCRQISNVSPARVMRVHFIRCDSCFAVNALSDSQRMTVIQSASIPLEDKNKQQALAKKLYG